MAVVVEVSFAIVVALVEVVVGEEVVVVVEVSFVDNLDINGIVVEVAIVVEGCVKIGPVGSVLIPVFKQLCIPIKESSIKILNANGNLLF